MVPIEDIEFQGLIGNRSLIEITGQEFFNALAKLGWREAHAGSKMLDEHGDPRLDKHGRVRRTSAHILARLRERGPRWGILTPNDFARALRDGTTQQAGGGAKMRICNQGEFVVIYREENCSLITVRDP